MKFRKMLFHVKPDDSSVEDAVDSAIAEAASSVVDNKGDDESKAEDAKLELFARKVSDAVTKSIAELLNPSKKPDDEESKPKRKPAPVAPKPKKRVFSFFG